MKTYSRTETIARMNALAGANVPFLFIVDYAQEQSLKARRGRRRTASMRTAEMRVI